MISKPLEVFAKNTNLKTSENNVSGIYKKYFLTVGEEKNKRIININAFFGDTDENSIKLLAIGDMIRDNLSKYEIVNYEITETFLTLTTQAPITLLHKTLDFAIEILADYEIPNADFCTLCCQKFQPGARKKVVSINDDKYLLCDTCALETVENANEQIAQKEIQNKQVQLFRGSVGAVIGGLVGLLLYAVLFYVFPFSKSMPFFNYALCVLGFVVGTTAFYGYKIASKNIQNSSIVSIAIITSVTVFISHLIAAVILFTKLNGLSWANFTLVKFSFIGAQFTSKPQLVYLLTGYSIALIAAAMALFIFTYIELKGTGAYKRTVVSVQTIR